MSKVLTKRTIGILIVRLSNIAAVSILLCFTDVATLNTTSITILITIAIYLVCLGWYFSQKYYSKREFTHNLNYRRDPAKPWWDNRM